MRSYIAVFISGVLFAVGLAVAGMTQPAKVVGFLDLFGHWDPSLAFVMGGAILAYFPLYRIITQRRTPLFAARFLLPTRNDIDAKLVVGAGLFGVGWGLGGFCPGPALTSAGGVVAPALVFTAAMAGGFLLHRLFDGLTSRSAPQVEDNVSPPAPAATTDAEAA